MKLIETLGLSAALIIAGIALDCRGQQTDPTNPNQPSDQRPPPVRQGRAMGGIGPVMSVLTDEQRRSVFRAMQAERNELRELEPKLRDARRELLNFAVNGAFDETAVQKQAAEVANLEARMTVLRIKALSQAKPPLSADQIERIKNAPAAGGSAQRRPPWIQDQERHSSVQNTNRDINDLPPKQ